MNITLKELIRIFSLNDVSRLMNEVQNLGIKLYDEKGEMKRLNEVIVELLERVEETERLNKDKKLKGYMFDSLVYRFKDAQNKSFMSEVHNFKSEKYCTEGEAINKIKNRQNRDLMRFIQILDEAIGEHD